MQQLFISTYSQNGYLGRKLKIQQVSCELVRRKLAFARFSPMWNIGEYVNAPL